MGKILAAIAGALLLVCVAFVVVFFLVKLLWAWTIPDLFPKAVEEGLIAREIGWLTSVKIAIFIAVLSGFARVSVSRK